MNRQQKEHVVQSLQGDFKQNHTSFLVGYKGLTVLQLEKLRRSLRQQGGSLKVVKARLIKRAIQDFDGAGDLVPYCKEQIAMVFAPEPTAAAKLLYQFSKDNEALLLVAGFSESKVFDKELIAFMASLPPVDVLRAQLCAVLMGPLTGLAVVLNAVATKDSDPAQDAAASDDVQGNE